MFSQVFKRALQDLLPTPSKSHYLFNLRDIWKIFLGLCVLSPKKANSPEVVMRCWCHEIQRIFGDRLTDKGDLEWMRKQIETHVQESFRTFLQCVVAFLLAHCRCALPSASVSPRAFLPVCVEKASHFTDYLVFCACSSSGVVRTLPLKCLFPLPCHRSVPLSVSLIICDRWCRSGAKSCSDFVLNGPWRHSAAVTFLAGTWIRSHSLAVTMGNLMFSKELWASNVVATPSC